MKKHEEDLQRKIEAGLTPGSDELDVKAYEEVFARLRKKPEVHLPADFADKVIMRVIERKQRGASTDFIWFGVGIFFLIVAFVVAVVMTGFKPSLGFLNGMSAYGPLFVFGLVLILILNRFDKKLIRKADVDRL